MHSPAKLIFALSILTQDPVRCPHENHSRCESPLVRIVYDFDLEHSPYDSQWKKAQIKTEIAYGTTVDVWCGSTTNAEKLIMTRNGEKLDTKKKYLNAIVWRRNLDLLTTENIECTDVGSNCTSSVIILVTPRFEVISTNVQKFLNANSTSFAVQFGESMSVVCSGPDTVRLVITQNGNVLSTERKDNTVKLFVKKPDLLMSEYVCSNTGYSYNSSVVVKVTPTIYLIKTLYVYSGVKTYFLEYKNSNVKVYCSGLRAVKLTSDGDDHLTKRNVNADESTIVVIKKIDKEVFNFNCSDYELSDYVNTVQVRIVPWMEVSISPDIHNVGIRDDMIQYQIKYGYPLEIICFGPDSNKLNIHNYVKELEDDELEGAKVILNKTAVKFVLNDPSMDLKIIFYCSTETSASASVQVSLLPADVTDFHCISYNGQYLNCSWTAPSNKLNFTLSYTENNIFTLICVRRQTSRRSQYCVWDYEFDNHKDIKVLTILLRSCNHVNCSNQTFYIDHASVVKPAPPDDLKVLKTTTHGAVLKWYSHSINVAGEYFANHKNDFHHKLQYWYSGIQPREVNSSLITCNDILNCKIELDLPCPGQFYEVTVQQKLKKTVGEEFWSDPRSVAFHTVASYDKTDDPTCSWKPRKTPEVMTYLVQELKEKVHLDLQILKKELSALKDKLATIRAYQDQRR